VLVLHVLLPQGSIKGLEHWAPPSTDTHAGGLLPLSPPSPEPPLLLALPSAGLPPPLPLPLLLPLEEPLELVLPELPPLLPELVLDPPSLPLAGAAELPPQWASANGTQEKSGAKCSQRAYGFMDHLQSRGRTLQLGLALRPSQRRILDKAQPTTSRGRAAPTRIFAFEANASSGSAQMNIAQRARLRRCS